MKKTRLTALFIGLFFAGHAQTKDFIDQPYIEVAGNADTLVTPDEIYIDIALSEKDTRNKVSMEQLELNMYDALKGMGIDVAKDLTTTDIASNFKNYFLKGQEVLKSKNYQLKVKDAVTASKVFMKLEDLGIANSNIDHVDYSATEKVKNLMRSRAVENARQRATALTQPLHQQVGSAIFLSDNENYFVHPMMADASANFKVRGYGNADQPMPQIDFEKIKISANINAKFILR